MSRSSTLGRVMTIPGALAVSMIDLDSGKTLGVAGSAQLTDSWTGLGSAVVRASMDTVSALDEEEKLEELVISGTRCFHLLRIAPQPPGAHQVFIHLALDRARANLAMARLDLKAIVEEAQDDVDAPPSPPPQRTSTVDDEHASFTGSGSPREQCDPRAPGDQAPPPLPRRSRGSPTSHAPQPDSEKLDRGTLTRIPGLNVKPPDIETMRRIASALREFQ